MFEAHFDMARRTAEGNVCTGIPQPWEVGFAGMILGSLDPFQSLGLGGWHGTVPPLPVPSAQAAEPPTKEDELIQKAMERPWKKRREGTDSDRKEAARLKCLTLWRQAILKLFPASKLAAKLEQETPEDIEQGGLLEPVLS